MQGLRDMLEISRKSGSLSNPLVGPKKVSRSCQTDDLPQEPVCCPTAGIPAGLDSSISQEVTLSSQIYRVSYLVADLGWVDLDVGSSPSWWWWAVNVATLCPGRVVEHPKYI